jgi:lactose/L-arabinose transport system substrate-binding protein
MKRGMAIVFASILALALVPGLAAQKKLTVWCWDPTFNIYAMKQAAVVYNKAHADVNIEIVDMAQDIEAKVISGLQAGGAGLPDIALFQDYRIEQFLHDYPNAFVDLKAAGVDYSKFAAYKVGPMTVGKAIYGIPFDTGSTGLWLRTDYIKAAGLNPDSYYGKKLTWSDVIKLGVAVKAKTGKPLLAYQSDNFDMLRIVVQSTGGQFFKGDGTLDLQSDAFKKSLALFKELNDKGLLYQVVGWSDWVNAINSDKSAGFLNAIWMVGSVKSRPENAGKYMVIPTPLIEGVKGAANASNNGGSSWYVFSSSPSKALAIDFLKSVWATNTPANLEFYNTILKGAGAMGTFLPSQSGSNYSANDEFFYKNQPVYKDFASWMANVPVLRYTPNYVPMRDSVAHATLNYFQGKLKTIDDTIAAAEAEYKQVMGQ